MHIAILGAEGTNKAELAQALPRLLADQAPGCTLTVASKPGEVLRSDIILLMGLDAPAAANDRDSTEAHRRLQDDALLRQALEAALLNYVVIYGQGAVRVQRALQTILQAKAGKARLSLPPNHTSTPWQWACDKCSDGACEQHLFTRLLKPEAA